MAEAIPPQPAWSPLWSGPLEAGDTRFLVSLRPEGIPRLEEIGVDASVVGFTLLQENVSDELRGRVFATLYTVVRLCLLAALTVAGAAGCRCRCWRTDHAHPRDRSTARRQSVSSDSRSHSGVSSAASTIASTGGSVAATSSSSTSQIPSG